MCITQHTSALHPSNNTPLPTPPPAAHNTTITTPQHPTVFGSGGLSESTTMSLLSNALADNAHLIPRRRTFFSSLCAWERGLGPWVTPPPRHCVCIGWVWVCVAVFSYVCVHTCSVQYKVYRFFVCHVWAIHHTYPTPHYGTQTHTRKATLHTCGARILPARALPPPFWAHGLRPPPRTSPRVFVLCVPCCRRARCHRTTRCRMSRRMGTSNTSPGRV